MPTIPTLEPTFEHASIEEECRRLWEESGIHRFQPEGDGEIFSVAHLTVLDFLDLRFTNRECSVPATIWGSGFSLAAQIESRSDMADLLTGLPCLGTPVYHHRLPLFYRLLLFCPEVLFPRPRRAYGGGRG